MTYLHVFQIISSLKKKFVIFYLELQGSEADTSEFLWRSGGQRTISKTWISSFTMWLSRDRTQVVRFGGKCPYTLSQLTSSKRCAFSYLILLQSVFSTVVLQIIYYEAVRRKRKLMERRKKARELLRALRKIKVRTEAGEMAQL